MRVVPALDLRGGRVVRLLRGDFAHETVYGDDPADLVRRYASEGATRLHVVDLDAAAGSDDNRDLVAGIVSRAGVEVQVAGGVRTAGAVDEWLAAGATAVVMGTAAVRDPVLLRSCANARPGRVMAALDVKDGRPAVTGWTATEARTLESLLAEWAPARLGGVILTCVDRDGTLAGPDLDTLARVLRATPHAVTYSGGIATLADLRSLAAAGAQGVILGRSLLDGRFSLVEAIAECAARS